MPPPSLDTHQRDSDVPPASVDDRTQHVPPRVRRRNRQINSCLECRRRKLKCDKGSPCANCTKIARPCVFITSNADVDAQKRLAEAKEQMCVVERSLEEDVVRLSRSKPSSTFDNRSQSVLPGQEESHSSQEDDEDTKDLDANRFVSEDAAYYDDDGVDRNDDLVDLGIAMGKVRITERIGGLVRPRFSEELAQALLELPPSEHARPYMASEQDSQDWLAPSRDYVSPSSGFFFAPGVEKTSLMAYLPSRSMVNRLIEHYWEAVHVLAKIVHRPSFERQLARFWDNFQQGIEPRASFQAIVFATLLTSITSMSEDRVLTEFGVDKRNLVDNFRQGTEAALAKANFLHTTKLETMQAFVMYLIPLCRGEVSRAHSALTGTAIRLAECMGLHRDPMNYSSSPVEIQVRRLVWYQICFLDLRTCEATGPRPQIRHDDYDTKFPLNIDDADLDRAEHGDSRIDVSKDRHHFTDMTITRMRFECYEMHRLLRSERPKLEQKRPDGTRKVTLVTLLSRIQSFKAAMEKTYLPMMQRNVPLHALASEIYGILSDRMYISLLQKYLSSDHTKLPTRLRQLVMSASVRVLERSMVIEQQPALSKWSWYIGAFLQYHQALLLLNELYTGHNEPEVEARIWKCLDFVFELQPGGSNMEKTRYILEEIISKHRVYTSMKKVRAPNNMPHAGPRTYTLGYQARLEEERERSTSLPSNISGPSSPATGIGSSANVQQTPPPPLTPASQRRASPPQTMSFPGAVPNIDWGTIDLPGPISTLQQHFSGTEYNFNDYVPPISSGPEHLAPPTTFPTMDNTYGTKEMSPPGAVDRGEVAGFTTGSSPSDTMDVLNDIDWKEIDMMFGGEEHGSGMLIPPFSFPQFDASDFTSQQL